MQSIHALTDRHPRSTVVLWCLRIAFYSIIVGWLFSLVWSIDIELPILKAIVVVDGQVWWMDLYDFGGKRPKQWSLDVCSASEMVDCFEYHRSFGVRVWAPYQPSIGWDREWGFPLWFVFAPLGLLWLGAERQKRRVSRGCCRQCGYDLRVLTEPRCPECGMPFEPARERS